MVRWLFITGLLCIAASFAWPWLAKFGFGKLPGDIVIDRPGSQIYIPIVSCIVLSLVLNLIFWLVRKLG